MIKKPRTRSFRLDKETEDQVRGRFGPNHRLKTFSEFIREGLQLRLKQEDPYLGWSIKR